MSLRVVRPAAITSKPSSCTLCINKQRPFSHSNHNAKRYKTSNLQMKVQKRFLTCIWTKVYQDLQQMTTISRIWMDIDSVIRLDLCKFKSPFRLQFSLKNITLQICCTTEHSEPFLLLQGTHLFTSRQFAQSLICEIHPWIAPTQTNSLLRLSAPFILTTISTWIAHLLSSACLILLLESQWLLSLLIVLRTHQIIYRANIPISITTIRLPSM
jgi:hypothetical protein